MIFKNSVGRSTCLNNLILQVLPGIDTLFILRYIVSHLNFDYRNFQ